MSTFVDKLRPPRWKVACGVGVVSLVSLAAWGWGALPVLLASVAWLVWPWTPRERFRSAHCGQGRTRGPDGWATGKDIARHLHAAAPCVRLGSTVVGPALHRECRVGVEETIGILGGPRGGKSLEMASVIRRHVGPAFVSSTRLDLLTTTYTARSASGPVWVFLPETVGGHESTVKFPVERGCADEEVATQTASAMVGATDKGSADDSTWLQSATSVLRALLMAADLDPTRDMRDVYRWVITSPNREPVDILAAHGRDVVAGELVAEIASPSEKTSASVMRAVKLAVQFMGSESAARAVCPGPGDDILDIRDLIERNGTLYSITTQSELDPLAPLSAVLTSRLFTTARQVAADRGRALDPSFLLALDEIKVTARVPLHDWAATAAGDGILIVWSAQSPSQLRERWGADAMEAILDCSTTLLVFGGLKAPSDLDRFTDLCGQRREVVEDQHGKPTDQVEKVDVLTHAQLSSLRKFRALLITRECRPTIVATARWQVGRGAALDDIFRRPQMPAEQTVEVSGPLALPAPRKALTAPMVVDPAPLPPADDREEVSA